MKPFILSDDVIYRIKDKFQQEMTLGLSKSGKSDLPMTVTFVTESINEADGDYVAICAHAQNFSVTLVKLRPNSLPEIQRKDYEIDSSVFRMSYRKIFEVFTDCMKDFFYEFQLGGAVIPVGFCSNLPMIHFSLDTAIIPCFGDRCFSKPCQKDVKSYFEEILCRYNYQGNMQEYTSLSNISTSSSSKGGGSNGIHHVLFDAKILGCESVLGLDINPETCHKLLNKLKVLLDTGEPLKEVVLEISPTGVRVQDKGVKNVLHHHLLNKISYITQDFVNYNVFGYIFGDYVKGHQFFAFITVCESTQVILFLQEIFLLKIMQKQKEELNMKASQVFLTLKNFLNIAQDLKAKEREIPSTLKKRVDLVEDISWWLEGCCGDATPTCLDPEESTLNVRIQELYLTAVTMKLIEREQEEEAELRRAKAAKRHLRKKKVQHVDVKRMDGSLAEKKTSGPVHMKVIQLLKKYADDFKSALEDRKIKLELLEEKTAKLINNDDSKKSNSEAIMYLEKLCSDVHQEIEIEINHTKEKIESLVLNENKERKKIELKVSTVHLGSKQFLKSVQIKPNENIFEDFSLPASCSETSEISNQIKVCKEYFLNALKTRKEEVNELNYFISGLHFRDDRLPSEETAAVILSRRLLVSATKMHFREMISTESYLSKLKDAENQIVFAVPDVLLYVKEIYYLFLHRLEKMHNLLEEIMDKIPSGSEVTTCKKLYQDLKNMKEIEIQDIEGNISKLKDRECYVDDNVSSLCFKLFKNAVVSRKKEFDELVNNLDLLEATEVDDSDNEGIDLISNCKDVFLTSIVIREKEIEILEYEMEKSFNFSTSQHPQVLVTLEDLFYAALELEKQCYEKLLLNEDKDDDNKDQVLPVVYTLKNLFDVVSIGLKQKQMAKSDDPAEAKTLQIYASLEEFLSVSFDLKQKDIEIPLEVLKLELEKVLSNMIAAVKKREKERNLERKRHLQALKISNSWKKVFLIAAEMRKVEIMKVVPAKVKVTKEEDAILKTLKKDERLNVDNEGRLLATSWRKIFATVVGMKRREIEQIKKLIREPDKSNLDEKKDDEKSVKEHKGGSTVTDLPDDEYLQIIGDETEECPHAELLHVISTCKQIFNIVIEKGTSELEEMEHDMRPIFNPEYDEENIEYEEDEITKALNQMKQILKDHFAYVKERESEFTNSVETLTFLEENIKSEVSLAQETVKRYLLYELDKEEKDMRALIGDIENLDEAFKDLMAVQSEELPPFTDLVVDVLSSEDIDVSEDNENEQQQSDLEEKKRLSKFTREQIHDLLLEIASEQKGENEVEEDPNKLKALNVYETCKAFFISAVEFRKQNIEVLQTDINILEHSFSKKMKKKEKIKRALSNVKTCKDRLSQVLETLQSEIKSMEQQLDKIAKAYPTQQEVAEVKPSEIVAMSRKLFSSFVEARQNNLHLMDVELGLLLGKENSLMSEMNMNAESTDILRTEILESCKDLVIGSVDLKMKEVDEISMCLDILNDTEQKIENHLSQLDSEEKKASSSNLEKVKDAISTCQKLNVSASEKAKRGLKDAEKELQLLKDVLDAVEESLVTATCTYLLKTNIERRDTEIYAQSKVLKTLEANVKNLEVTEQDIEDYLNTQDPKTVIPEVLPSTPLSFIDRRKSTQVLFSDVEARKDSSYYIDKKAEELNLEVSSSNVDEIRDIIGLLKVEEFVKQGLDYLRARLLVKCEEIEQLEADRDKLKVTAINVEKEDSKVLEICQNVVFKIKEQLEAEYEAAVNELKNLEKVNIEEIPENIDEIEFVGNCKRILKDVIKNRNTHQSLIEFELMKLVRYQDSRIVQICKDQLLFLLKSSNEEALATKEKMKTTERTGVKQELFEICRNDLQELSQLVIGAIHLTESVLQSITKQKRKIDTEDDQFVAVCKELFLSQIMQRKKEISLFKQIADQVTETNLTIENMNKEAQFIFKVIYEVAECALQVRQQEKEQIECELIKRMDIKISDAVTKCEQFFMEMSESLKNDVVEFRKELDDISAKRKQVSNFEKEEFSALVTKYDNYVFSVIEKTIHYGKELKKKVDNFRGKPDVTKIEEIDMDVVDASDNESGRKKLKTEASDMLSLCKELLDHIIDNFNFGIKDIMAALKQLQTLKGHAVKKTTKPLSETLSVNHNYTARQLELLDELEQEILDSERGKEELEFCEHLFVTTIDQKENKIQIFKQIREKLNNLDVDLSSKAANLIYGWWCLCDIIHDTFINQNGILENKITDVKSSSVHQEREETLQKYENALSLVTCMLEENLGEILVKLQELKNKELELKKQIAYTYVKSKEILQESVKLLEEELNVVTESLESLEKYSPVSETNPDITDMSDAEKVVEDCRHFLQMHINLMKEDIHALNLQLKYFIGQCKETKQKETSILPSWQKRFLSFMNMEKDDSDVIKQTFLSDSPESNDLKQGDDSVESETKLKAMKYKDLLLSIQDKRLKQPIFCVSAWNDILVQAFLLEQLKGHEGINIKEFTETESEESSSEISQFHNERSWDELLLCVMDIISKQAEISSKLQSIKQAHISLNPLTAVLSNATDSWCEQICEEIIVKGQECTLLQWKSRINPKEYSEYAAGYQYGGENDGKKTGTSDHDIKNFTINIEAHTPGSDRSSSGDYNEKSFSFESWDNIFEDAYKVIKEGNQLVGELKKQNTRIQYQAARLYSSWNDCFSKAVESRKKELKEELKQNSVLHSIAKRMKDKIQSGFQEPILESMTSHSESWAEKISDMFHSYEEELAKAVNTKKQEMKQTSVQSKPVNSEDEVEDHPFLEIKTEELIKQGKRMLTLALDIKSSETSSMEKKLGYFSNIDKNFSENVETHKSIDVWAKIVSAALDFDRNGFQLHQQKKKSSLKSEELFSIAEKRLTKELETGIVQQEKSEGSHNFFLDEQTHSKRWDEILKIVPDVLLKDLEKAKKLGLKMKMHVEDEDVENLNDSSEDSSHWIDIFLDAAEQKVKEMNPNQIDLHEIIKQNLLSQIWPTWNEILYVFSEYRHSEIKERLFTNNIVFADEKALLNLKLLASHHIFNWDHIIIAAIEEFLKIIENKNKENLDDSESKRRFLLTILENKFDETHHLNNEIKSKQHFEGYKWIDLLPTKEVERTFQLDEELIEKKMLEDHTSSFKEETIPDDLIWKHIFPFAVHVCRKNRRDYLKFSKMTSMEKLMGTKYSKADELKFLKVKLHQEQERIKKFTNDVSLKSKKLMERFDMKDNSSNSECDTKGKINVSDVSHDLSIGQQIENYGPQYFSISATWREVFFAAVERNRKILYKLLQFKKLNSEKGSEVEKNDNDALTSRIAAERELFSVQNVLNLPITLRELFETVAVLQQKKLVLFNPSVDEDFNKIFEANQRQTEGLKAFDIIDKFKLIFSRGLFMRKREMEILELQLEKLENDEKTTSVLRILYDYCNMALKFRERENKIILQELECLNDCKDVFMSYVDFSTNQPLRLRNIKNIRLLKQEYQNIQFIQTDFQRKLLLHFNRCIRNLESSIDKRKDLKFQVDMKAVDSLLGNLNLKEQELLSASYRILTSISELRKAEIKHMETEAKNLKKKGSFESTMENKITELLSAVIPFLDDGLSERKTLESLLVNAIDFLEEAGRNVNYKVNKARVLSKQFLLNAIRSKKTEIKTMENKVNSLKLKVDCSKKKVAKIMTACENYIQKISDKRKADIQLLETYLEEMKDIPVAEFHSRCTQYFANALEKRKQEIADIENLTEPLKEKEELDSEMSSAIDEAMCEAFGIPQGMVFLKIQEEKRETQVAKLDPETISSCSEFYSKLVANIQNDIKATDENLKTLDSYKGSLAEELIEILCDFVRILNKEKEIMKTEIVMVASEINVFKEHQNKLSSDIDQILIICRDHLKNHLKEIAEDMKELKFQLKIFAGEDIEEQELEKIIQESPDEIDLFVPTSTNASTSGNYINVTESETLRFEGLLPAVTAILQSGLNWREDLIKSFTNELEQFPEFKNKSRQVVSGCLRNYFLVGEQRREENEKMQYISNSYDNIEDSYISKVCKDCIESVKFFNMEALNSIEFELDRLTNTIDLLQEEKNTILTFCENNILYTSHKIEEEVKSMNSDLSYLLLMGSAEGTELLSDCKELLRNGVNERNNEINLLQTYHDNWSSENEVLQVVTVCGKHLKYCLDKHQLETEKVQELLNLLEEESDMSGLLYSPALEAIMEANNALVEFLIPETYTFSYIQKELESKDKRLIEASQILYCSMLETFKIERESISSDIEYLQEISIEGSEVIETENQEITVNFCDLFLTTFNLKKAELERDVRKKVIAEDVDKKKADILVAEKFSSTNATKDGNAEVNLSYENLYNVEKETERIESMGNFKPFVQFDSYFKAKKQENKIKMDKKVVKEFIDLEVKLNAKVVETDIKSPVSLEGISGKESEHEPETFVNRVYEIKVLQIENEISLKRVKIGNVIKQRKYIMENLIKSKRQEMEESVMLKEKQMQCMIDNIKSEDSQVVCSLKDIFCDVIELKNKEKHTLKNKKEIEKYLDETLETKNVFVCLDNIFNAVLGVKEEELEMLKRSKFKEIEKLVKIMKREVKKRVIVAYDKLEAALRKYRQYEKSRALEYAGITKASEPKGSEREEYSIPDEDIFPDIKSFQDFILAFKSPYETEPKKSIPILKDFTSKTDDIKPHIPFMRPHAYALHGLAGHLLKLYKEEFRALSKVLYDLKNETENAIQHGVPFIRKEPTVNEEAINTEEKDFAFEITAVLNTNTSMLVLGSYLDTNCEISLNLRQNFGLAYFEDILNIEKWKCHHPHTRKVSIDAGIDKFENDDCLNLISTEFDKNVTTLPLNCSKFEMFIGDNGLLEQMRCIFLELHHQNLLGRKCGMENMFKSYGLSFTDIHKFLSAKSCSDLKSAFPVTFGSLSLDDVSVVLYVCKIVQLRGALLTSLYDDLFKSLKNYFNDVKPSVIINPKFLETSDKPYGRKGTDFVVTYFTTCQNTNVTDFQELKPLKGYHFPCLLQTPLLLGLASVLERLQKDKVCVITNSLFIQESSEYQSYVKTFTSAFAPDVNVNFIFSNSTSCAIGSALAAYMAFCQKRENPDIYLTELKGRVQENNKLFSVPSFFKILEHSELYTEALILANCYREHLNFDVPLSVIWAFNFLRENFEEAERLFKMHPVSLNRVNSMICGNIFSSENLHLSKKYCEFLRRNCDDLKVKIKAYRCIFRLLVNKKLYDEALMLIQQLKEMRIGLSELPMSSLQILHNFCLKNSERKDNMTSFCLPLKETYHSSSDSDME